MDKMTAENWKEMFAWIAGTFQDNCEFLCRLDARMGDGDLGLTMKKGYTAAAEAIAAMDDDWEKELDAQNKAASGL